MTQEVYYAELARLLRLKRVSWLQALKAAGMDCIYQNWRVQRSPSELARGIVAKVKEVHHEG